jgi:homoserine kinase type II
VSVFTPVKADQLGPLLHRLSLGSLRTVHGISQGVDNSNFLLNTRCGEYVLTLFERLTAEQLPFYLQLLDHLAVKQFPVIRLCHDHNGQALQRINGRYAVVADKSPGVHRMQPNQADCLALGQALAQMHIALRDFPLTLPNPFGMGWCQRVSQSLCLQLPASQQQRLQQELCWQAEWAACHYPALPSGIVHGDLFRDNVLFHDTSPSGECAQSSSSTISAFLDLYFAGHEALIFDIAVCLNDWCINSLSCTLQPDLALALLAGYQRQRQLSAQEKQMMGNMLRLTALRFWLSRQHEWLWPRAGVSYLPRDPQPYYQLLQYWQQPDAIGLLQSLL